MPRPVAFPLDKSVTPVAPEEDVWINVGQAAGHIGVCPQSIYNMIRDGRLRAFRSGRNIIRLRKSDVQALLVPVRED
jgi:excisionase family DNA binding protein